MEGLDHKGNYKRSSFTSSKMNNEDGFHLSTSQEPLFHSLKTQKAVWGQNSCLSLWHFCALSFIWVIFSLVLVSCSVVSPVPIPHFIILSDHYLCHPTNVTWPNPHLTSAMKMKVASPSKTSVSIHRATRHHNADESFEHSLPWRRQIVFFPILMWDTWLLYYISRVYVRIFLYVSMKTKLVIFSSCLLLIWNLCLMVEQRLLHFETVFQQLVYRCLVI